MNTTTSVQKNENPAAIEPARERATVLPPVDIYEQDGTLVIVADMPGVSEKDVEVVLENGDLTLRGRPSRAEPSGSVLYAEFEPADFERVFAVSDDVDPEGVRATIRNGVLRVELPKAKERQPRRIAVQAA